MYWSYIFGDNRKITEEYLQLKGIGVIQKHQINLKGVEPLVTTGSGEFYNSLLNNSIKISVKV